MWWGIKVFQRGSQGLVVFQCKQHKVSKKFMDSLAVWLKCGMDVRCPGGTTNLTSHVRHHHPQLLSITQSGAETVKETPWS